MKPIYLSFVVLLIGLLDAAQADEPKSPNKNLPVPGEVFLVKGHTAFIIPAKVDRSKNPKQWVWYAPTLPNLPGKEEQWMFEQFREAGIAIAGIDVGESYGSPAGRKLFSDFYRTLTESRGYASKPVLLGRSRGGLMMLSWATENPDRVAGFAGIYPVCNLASYPGVAKAAGAYELKPEELQVRLKEFNPIDRLSELAKAKVPLFAIHGDEDKVVPLDQNSGLLKERFTAMGGAMQLIVPKGQGHNMWDGFFQSEELVKFVKSCSSPLSAQQPGKTASDQ
jgi:pimeloyl-ACP methyl ester carboxylesterase